MELAGFTGCREEVELLLNLVESAVSLERIIIDVGLPDPPEDYLLSLPIMKTRNPNAGMCQNRAYKLKTLIPPQIDVVIIIQLQKLFFICMDNGI